MGWKCSFDTRENKDNFEDDNVVVQRIGKSDYILKLNKK
jgi:hypothetical protein